MITPKSRATPLRPQGAVTLEAVAASGWLAAAARLAELAFETDAACKFTEFGSEQVLGFRAQHLLGCHINDLLNVPADSFETARSIITLQSRSWQGDINVARADGILGVYRLAMAPKPASKPGLFSGIYGTLVDLAPCVPESGMAAMAQHRLICPHTGLALLPHFIDQVARRSDRLDVEDLPGTLILIGFHRARRHLHAITTTRIIEELREIIRPTDLPGRIASTTIALWCDGMDHLTGAERGAKFCKHLPAALPGHIPLSIGLVTRWPGSMDDPQTLLTRAGAALVEADLATERDKTGSWRVWSG